MHQAVRAFSFKTSIAFTTKCCGTSPSTALTRIVQITCAGTQGNLTVRKTKSFRAILTSNLVNFVCRHGMSIMLKLFKCCILRYSCKLSFAAFSVLGTGPGSCLCSIAQWSKKGHGINIPKSQKKRRREIPRMGKRGPCPQVRPYARQDR